MIRARFEKNESLLNASKKLADDNIKKFLLFFFGTDSSEQSH